MKLTRQQAINAHCKDCIVDPLDSGTWRKQVSDCISTDCALHEYRPLDKATSEAVKKAKYEAMTPNERKAYDIKVKEAAKHLKKA